MVNPDPDGKVKTAIAMDRQAELRSEAERLVREAGRVAPSGPEDEHKLLHELQVHHVELQLQNEELEAAHADAAAARDRYARLFDLSPVGVLEVAPDGRIVEANLAAARMLQGSKAQLAGARIDRRLALARVPTWRALLATTGQAGHGQAELELARPGSQTTVLHAESALDATTGTVLVTLVDISERSRAQEAEREAALMLEQANRTKGEFLIRMSHELRTPLNALLGFAQLMLADQLQRLEPAQRARVRHIERAGQQLLALIEASMDVARIEPGRIDVPSPQLQTPPNCDPEAPKTGPAGTGRRKSRRVLYIGNVQADRDLIEATVQTLPDVTLTTAIDGRSGIATARILRADLIIVGLNLPDMEGPAVLRALRRQQQTRRARCIAISTGTVSDAAAETYAETGASDFLECWRTPLAIDFLNGRLRALLS